MKKQTNSLTIQQNKQGSVAGSENRLSGLLPGCLLLTGIWGMLMQELSLGMQWLFVLLPAILALTAGLLIRWDKKWQALTVICALVLTGVCLAVFHRSLSSGIAGFMDKAGVWWFLRTGNYTPGYESAGSMRAVLLLGAVCSGFFTAFLLRLKRPVFQMLLTLAVLLLWMLGLLRSGWWLALYLLGMLLTLAGFASGQGKALTFSGVIALILAAVITGATLLSGVAPAKTELGTQLSESLHSLRYEDANNPMPEGVLENLGVYDPTDEPALEVTMAKWTPLYLRGFVAGHYTDTGWEPLDTAQLAGNADTLYTLQAEHFFAAEQGAKAWQSVEVVSDNTVSVRVLGACRSTAYLPYGAGTVTEGVLSSSDLQWEGLRAPAIDRYSAQLYPVEASYLLQAQLKDTDTAYRNSEAVYRDWVYAQYLTVPQAAHETLTKYFSFDGEMTTVQAKRQITQRLSELVEYNENILTHTGQQDFVSYVLEVSKSGYSVHYATLATLLLRCCGIPARYVEGYVVSPSQAEALGNGETLTLTQSNAHAWTEYYLDGVGWVPFDATVGYTHILNYELPSEGLPTQESAGEPEQQEQQQDPPEKQPQVNEEKTRQSQRISIQQAMGYALVLLVLVLVLLVLRTVLLRYGLYKRQRSFRGDDCRTACAGILCYIQVLAKSIGNMDSNLTVSCLAEQTSVLLDGKIGAAQLESLLNEVWYSDHAITQAQREMALSWLEQASAVWKEKISFVKRIWQRFITCRIL